MIKVIGWVERSKVPSWATRTPTVLPPAAPPILPAPSAPAPAAPAKKPVKARKGAPKPGPDGPLSDFINDDIPRK